MQLLLFGTIFIGFQRATAFQHEYYSLRPSFPILPPRCCLDLTNENWNPVASRKHSISLIVEHLAQLITSITTTCFNRAHLYYHNLMVYHRLQRAARKQRISRYEATSHPSYLLVLGINSLTALLETRVEVLKQLSFNNARNMYCIEFHHGAN